MKYTKGASEAVGIRMIVNNVKNFESSKCCLTISSTPSVTSIVPLNKQKYCFSVLCVLKETDGE